MIQSQYTTKNKGEQMENKDNYAIGLDIGTNSVGWAVINDDSSLRRYKKKSMHGVRKSEVAKTAEDRRLFRSIRRRQERKKYRIDLLQELFYPLIHDFDGGFFHRLDNTYENSDNNTYNLFVDKNFNDSHYYQMYPTIYHLRNHLVQSNKKEDIRLIYLALHHIIKSRGHFLYEGEQFSIEDTSIIEKAIAELFLNLNLSHDHFQSITSSLKDSKLNKSGKEDAILNIFSDMSLSKEDLVYVKAVIKGILSYKFNINHLFEGYDFKGTVYIQDVFDDAKGEALDDLLKSIDESEFRILENIHQIYSWVVLQEILDGKTSLSEAKLKAYDKHNNELKLLKKLLKKYDRKAYKQIFVRKNDNSYELYIKNSSVLDAENFNKHLKKVISSIKYDPTDSEDFFLINKELESNSLLTKLKTKDNASIPYQLNQMELMQILTKQGQFHPLLKDNIDKIGRLLSFRVPYFVGPTNPNSKFSTAVRLSNERITPWNFDSIIDLESSALKFIEVRTNKCTYLSEENVLPKKSIICQDYEVLNELNGIRFDGRKIENDLKLKIFNDLFLEKSNVTDKSLRDWLEINIEVRNAKTMEITGYQKEKAFSTTRSSAIFFSKYFSDIEKDKDVIENLIAWNTMITDKKILKSKIESMYPQLSDTVVDAVRKQNFDGWSRLSRRLLTELSSKRNNKTILETLYDTDNVFMTIINDNKLGFNKLIEQEQSKGVQNGNISYSDIEELACSPTVKKQIWQTISLIKELVKLEGNDPHSIFLEFAREEGEKKRTQSRKRQLEYLYDKISADLSEFKKEDLYKDLKSSDDIQLSNERVYLYFIQKGKCMYSGEALDLKQLSTYEVDHIIPQSLIKDNSFDNKVLVKTHTNQSKGDTLGIDPQVIRSRYDQWSKLRDSGLMSPKKFFNLTKTYANEEERADALNGFINRQLVETRQITKHVVALLKAAYPNTQVISIKADLLSNIRRKYGFIKLRNVNDFHHARDAYLTAVVGQFIATKYPNYFNGYNKPRYDVRLEKKDKHGFIISQMSKTQSNVITGEVYWDPSERIKMITSMMNRNDVLVTHQLVENKGAFYDQTIYGKDLATDKTIPRNDLMKDVNKYGGYSSEKVGYLIAVAITETKKSKSVTTHKVIKVPVRHAHNVSSYIDEFRVSNNYDEVKVTKDKILLNQLINYDGGYVRLSSDSEWANAQQLILPSKFDEMLLAIEKKWNHYKHDVDLLVEFYDVYSELILKHYKHYESYAENVIKNRSFFIDLDTEQKTDAINKMLIVTKASKSYTPISIGNFKLGASCGRLKQKSVLVDRGIIISQSLSGLNSSVIKI